MTSEGEYPPGPYQGSYGYPADGDDDGQPRRDDERGAHAPSGPWPGPDAYRADPPVSHPYPGPDAYRSDEPSPPPFRDAFRQSDRHPADPESVNGSPADEAPAERVAARAAVSVPGLLASPAEGGRTPGGSAADEAMPRPAPTTYGRPAQPSSFESAEQWSDPDSLDAGARFERPAPDEDRGMPDRAYPPAFDRPPARAANQPGVYGQPGHMPADDDDEPAGRHGVRGAEPAAPRQAAPESPGRSTAWPPDEPPVRTPGLYGQAASPATPGPQPLYGGAPPVQQGGTYADAQDADLAHDDPRSAENGAAPRSGGVVYGTPRTYGEPRPTPDDSREVDDWARNGTGGPSGDPEEWAANRPGPAPEEWAANRPGPPDDWAAPEPNGMPDAARGRGDMQARADQGRPALGPIPGQASGRAVVGPPPQRPSESPNGAGAGPASVWPEQPRSDAAPSGMPGSPSAPFPPQAPGPMGAASASPVINPPDLTRQPDGVRSPQASGAPAPAWSPGSGFGGPGAGSGPGRPGVGPGPDGPGGAPGPGGPGGWSGPGGPPARGGFGDRTAPVSPGRVYGGQPVPQPEPVDWDDPNDRGHGSPAPRRGYASPEPERGYAGPDPGRGPAGPPPNFGPGAPAPYAASGVPGHDDDGPGRIKRKWRIAGVIAIVVLVVGLGAGALYYTSRPNSPSYQIGACVQHSGDKVIAASCSAPGSFKIVSKVTDPAACPDAKNPYVSLDNNKTIYCLSPTQQ